MIRVPCGRRPVHDGWKYCVEGQLCPNCNAILILKATCLGVADRLESGQFANMPTIDAEIGRLRADVARVGED